MLDLHYFPGNASLTPHLLLEEIGAPFALKLVDRAQDAQHSAEYLRLNPNGTIPVLVDRRGGGELVLYETAAICLHLADTHPAADLIPPVGSAARAQAMKWLAWLATTPQQTLMLYFYPERWSDDKAAQAGIRERAETRVGTMLDQMDAELARHGGPFFTGARLGLLDPYVLMISRWTRGFARPARARPHLGPYLRRMLARSAVQRVFEREGIGAPLV